MEECNSTVAYVSKSREFSYHYQTIPERLRFLARKIGDKEVYVFHHPNGRRESISANKILERSVNIAHSLVKLGIKKGDVVAACLPNDVDGLLCIFGIICAGGVSLNAVIHKDDGSDLVDIMNKGKARCLIVKSSVSGAELKACRNFIDHVQNNGEAKSKNVPSLEYFLTLDSTDWCCLLLQNLPKDVSNGQQLPYLCPDDPTIIFPTSGSTGSSKLVHHSHFSAMITGCHLQESAAFQDDDIIYTERRMAWIGGFPFMYLHNGVKTVSKTAPVASFAEHCRMTYQFIKEENCTVACLLSPTIIGLVDEIGKSEIMLNNIHTGGLPISDVCMNAIGRITKCVTNCYGSSEGAFLSSCHVTRKDEYVNYCAGIPHGGVEIKIIDEHGKLAKRNEDGKVYVRSPALFRGYYNDNIKTREVLDSSGWFHTDDVGYIDEIGHLCVHGRRSDLILQSGKLLSPAAIEAFIKSHPDVLDILVVAISDNAKFEVACACIIAKEGRKLTPDDIREFYDSKLISTTDDAGRKLYPEQIMMFEAFPKLYTGKPDKRKLKEIATIRAKELVRRT